MSDIPEVLKSILELARWAPSGDNLQPWRFEILGEDRLRLHIRRENDVYDFGGAATRTTSGVMLETLRIAASSQARGMKWVLAFEDPAALKFEIDFPLLPSLAQDPLAAWIKQRSVDRRPYRMQALTEAEKQALQSAVGPMFQIRWFETFAEKWAITRLNARATWLRLTIPETFAIHQRIIDWDNRLSPDRVPATAVGLDPMTRQLMRWALGNWARASFLNHYLAGPLMPVIEMDVLPGLRCAAHFAFTCPQALTSRDEIFLAAGQALQRFWLTAASLGLVMQPAFATLAFAYYGERARSFSTEPGTASKATAIAQEFNLRFGLGSEQAPFLGRIGRQVVAPPSSRSTRRELSELIYR
ncbi:MAG: nitroreductase family protein [Burkholderiales bacterium]|nr:nitroreductase family protein [Burkholderiales bacterium]